MNAPKELKFIIFIIGTFISTSLLASEGPQSGKVLEDSHISDRLQTTFIENTGQVPDSKIVFFANFINGTVFVKNNGMLSYDFLPDKENNLLINEKFTPRKV